MEVPDAAVPDAAVPAAAVVGEAEVTADDDVVNGHGQQPETEAVEPSIPSPQTPAVVET